jgi:hypothetical protein
MKYDRETINLTLESYRRAFNRMSDRVKLIDWYHRGYPGSGMVFDGKVGAGLDPKELIPEIDEITFNIEDLFEFGRPRLIGGGYHIYKSDYFKIFGWVVEPYEAASKDWSPDYENKCINDIGEESIPMKLEIKIRVLSLKCEVGFPSWGVRDFMDSKKATQIDGMLDGAKPIIAKKYNEALKRAKEQVEAWRSEVRKCSDLVTGLDVR